MKTIYLASDSKARKKLLSVFGMKFKVLPSKISESHDHSHISYAALVKRNALQKAQAAVSKVKSGIVIGADTIVVQNNRVFGKPKNLRDARIMLGKLSGKTQWVYTGLAVIDKDTRRQKVSYEKTKIIMDRLSDGQIREYLESVFPLDKAGGFDIQGKGAFFIRRIEGCFYNVVGLPMRLLYRMLGALGIRVFFLACGLLSAALMGGCTTEYNIVTGQEEKFYYNTEREVKMGQSVSREVEKKYKLVEDPLVQKRVEDIGERIAAVCDRKDITYHFKALDDDEVNAVSLPGGFVYVNKGLIDKVVNDDELAAVLAHEVGHIVARHSIKKLQGAMSYNFLRILLSQAPSGGAMGQAADVAFLELFLGYGREDELLADQLGARYTKLAGYDPRAMLTFLKKLQEVNRKRPAAPFSYFKTHPYVPDRMRVVKQELGENMNFSDYINIEDTPHE